MTTYKEAGVDIAAGNESVDRIKPLARSTFTDGVLADIGAFGAFFEPDLDGIETPVLVSSVDGVGTKVKVAGMTGIYNTVGQDLVNHCVNDIATSGAKPLFFLDYYATSDLHPGHVESIVSGFAVACKENGCALIGGEIAEMPGVYAEGEFDLVGTVVGLVDRNDIIDGSEIQKGDVLIGLPSTGLHTNGYSLARSVLFEHFDIDDQPDELSGASVGEAMLQVHRSYLEAIQVLHRSGLLRGVAHITGGGLPGNIQRVVPGEFTIDYDAWERPGLFRLIQTSGDVPEKEMRTTFNLGIGLVLIVRQPDAPHVVAALSEIDEEPMEIGRVETIS